MGEMQDTVTAEFRRVALAARLSFADQRGFANVGTFYIHDGLDPVLSVSYRFGDASCVLGYSGPAAVAWKATRWRDSEGARWDPHSSEIKAWHVEYGKPGALATQVRMLAEMLAAGARARQEETLSAGPERAALNEVQRGVARALARCRRENPEAGDALDELAEDLADILAPEPGRRRAFMDAAAAWAGPAPAAGGTPGQVPGPPALAGPDAELGGLTAPGRCPCRGRSDPAAVAGE